MKFSSQKYLVFFMTLVMVGIVMANNQNSNNKNGGGGKGGKFSPASKPTSSPTCYQPMKNIKGKSKKIEKNGKSKDMKGPKASKCTTSVGANNGNGIPPPPPGYSGSGTSGKGGPKMDHNNKHAPTDSPTPAPISKKGGGGGGDGLPPPPPGVGAASGPVVPGTIKGSDYSTGGNAKTKVSGKMASPTFSPTKPPVSIKGLPKGLRG
jgi:hypothetical protein